MVRLIFVPLARFCPGAGSCAITWLVEKGILSFLIAPTAKPSAAIFCLAAASEIFVYVPTVLISGPVDMFKTIAEPIFTAAPFGGLVPIALPASMKSLLWLFWVICKHGLCLQAPARAARASSAFF